MLMRSREPQAPLMCRCHPGQPARREKMKSENPSTSPCMGAGRPEELESPGRGMRAQNKLRRAKRRQATAVAAPDLTVLQTASITGRTLAAYTRHCEWFLAIRRRLWPEGSGREEVESALLKALDEVFLEGENLAVGQKMYASVLYFLPGLKGTHRAPFPRAVQALRGWRKLAPPQSRQRLPFEVLALGVHQLLLEERIETALWAWLCFELYLRPGEADGLREKDLVPPLNRGAHRRWRGDAARAGDHGRLEDRRVRRGADAGSGVAGSAGARAHEDGVGAIPWGDAHVDDAQHSPSLPVELRRPQDCVAAGAANSGRRAGPPHRARLPAATRRRRVARLRHEG